MRIATTAAAAVIGALGLIFLIGSQGQLSRIVIGVLLMGSAIAVGLVPRLRPTRTTVVQQLDLSGDVALQSLACSQCSASLDRSSVSVRAGAVFVECPFCGADYQLEEAPRW